VDPALQATVAEIRREAKDGGTMQNEERRGERYARLNELVDYRVSAEDPDPRGWTVVDQSAQPLGRVDDLIVDTDAMKVRYLEVDLAGMGSGRARIPTERVDVDRERQRVVLAGDRTDLASFVAAQATAERAGTVESADTIDRPPTATAANRADDGGRLTVAEEELRVGTRPAQAGEVVVGKHVETERVTTPVQRQVERVRIERRPATASTAGTAELREGEIRIPVMEEQVVVEKQPVIKEEVVVTRERGTETEQVQADLRRERVHVEGDETLIDEDGTPRTRAGGGNRG
jgi:uncharacterized protein (TIGR02271 family)